MQNEMVHGNVLEPRLEVTPPWKLTAWGAQFSASVKEEDNEDGGHVQEGSECRPGAEAPASLDNRGDKSLSESGKSLDEATMTRALRLVAIPGTTSSVRFAIALVALRGLVTAPLLVFVTPVVIVAGNGYSLVGVIRSGLGLELVGKWGALSFLAFVMLLAVGVGFAFTIGGLVLVHQLLNHSLLVLEFGLKS